MLRCYLDCRTAVRGKSRCFDCQRKRDQAKRAKRPAFKKHTEQQRRARAVAKWQAHDRPLCALQQREVRVGAPILDYPARPGPLAPRTRDDRPRRR
jgi:hypothetical protein